MCWPEMPCHSAANTLPMETPYRPMHREMRKKRMGAKISARGSSTRLAYERGCVMVFEQRKVLLGFYKNLACSPPAGAFAISGVVCGAKCLAWDALLLCASCHDPPDLKIFTRNLCFAVSSYDIPSCLSICQLRKNDFLGAVETLYVARGKKHDIHFMPLNIFANMIYYTYYFVG